MGRAISVHPDTFKVMYFAWWPLSEPRDIARRTTTSLDGPQRRSLYCDVARWTMTLLAEPRRRSPDRDVARYTAMSLFGPRQISLDRDVARWMATSLVEWRRRSADRDVACRTVSSRSESSPPLMAANRLARDCATRQTRSLLRLVPVSDWLSRYFLSGERRLCRFSKFTARTDFWLV